jgi:hypothetical protein
MNVMILLGVRIGKVIRQDKIYRISKGCQGFSLLKIVAFSSPLG